MRGRHIELKLICCEHRVCACVFLISAFILSFYSLQNPLHICYAAIFSLFIYFLFMFFFYFRSFSFFLLLLLIFFFIIIFFFCLNLMPRLFLWLFFFYFDALALHFLFVICRVWEKASFTSSSSVRFGRNPASQAIFAPFAPDLCRQRFPHLFDSSNTFLVASFILLNI